MLLIIDHSFKVQLISFCHLEQAGSNVIEIAIWEDEYVQGHFSGGKLRPVLMRIVNDPNCKWHLIGVFPLGIFSYSLMTYSNAPYRSDIGPNMAESDPTRSLPRRARHLDAQ